MNAGGAWKYIDDVFIGHDITEEQANIMVEVLEANGYVVQPRKYDPHKAFLIKEKLK